MRKKTNRRFLIGLDEVGRGPLAGPVVAVAVKIKKERSFFWKLGIKDSKKLTAKKREYFYKIFMKHPFLEWGMGVVSEKRIDKINILQATKRAMEKALQKIDCKNSLFLIDGNFKINFCGEQISLPKADEKILECSIASIIAKVKRDKMMENLHKKYPLYGFSFHKGYGTEKHRKAIKKYGVSPVHRKSFKLL